MKKSFKFLTFFAAAMMVAGTFTGCGSDSDDNGGKKEEPKPPTGGIKISDMDWAIPTYDEGDVMNGGKPETIDGVYNEIVKQSYPPTWKEVEDPTNPGQWDIWVDGVNTGEKGPIPHYATQTCTMNWKAESDWSDEVGLLKISKAAQVKLIAEAKERTGQENPKVYIIAARLGATKGVRYSATVYKGTQAAPVEVSTGKGKISQGGYARYALTNAVEITGAEDFYVGILAKYSGEPSSFRPFYILGNTVCDESHDMAYGTWPGREAEFPSFGFVPDSEMFIQELNDPEESARWGWVKNDLRGVVNLQLIAEFGVTEEE